MLFAADLPALCCPKRLAAVQNREAVAHGLSMADICLMKTTATPSLHALSIIANTLTVERLGLCQDTIQGQKDSE